MPLISQKITLNFLGLKLRMKPASNDHENGQGDSKQVNNQKPSLLAVVVCKDISNNEGDSQEKYEKGEKGMNGKPDPLKMWRAFFKLNESPTDLIHNCRKVHVVGIAFNVQHGVNAMVEGEYAIGFNNR
jgi:hypothetical protein